ncbi:helix-turn-helix domain-containing protein [uncultured Sphingomonas sp.]|uniref:helix-turn-helix domain-containing protein n=1 Tax=uncultured Sphingomonas sp. TaxID=158754 RepID=UPI0035CC1931
MTEGDPVQGPVQGSGSSGATGPDTVGDQLRAAREALGLTLDDVGARTRVPLRHLRSIEAGAYAGLPSGAYAVGFARAYARAVGLSDAAVAKEVRVELDRAGPKKVDYTPYEMADPARVPSRGVALVAAGLALAFLILGGLWFASTRFDTGDGAATSPPDAVVASTPSAPTPAVTPTAGGQVTLAAADDVWLRVYDADDRTLYTGTMKQGERFDVPADARDPRIDVGRPDKLQVTLNGSAVPALGTGERPVNDVRVGGSAIAERIAGGAVAAPTGTSSAVPAAGAAAAAGTVAAVRARPGPTESQARPRRVLTETQRANLESAARVRAQTLR